MCKVEEVITNIDIIFHLMTSNGKGLEVLVDMKERML